CSVFPIHFLWSWSVRYPPSICAARGSNVTINCTFTYPPENNIKQVLWCSMRSNYGKCHYQPYVYDSEANNSQSFQYIGDKTSDCSLLISNINQAHSGEYRFRFITNKEDGHWTGYSGVNISVHVSMCRSRENGSTIPGDLLILTCTLNCSGNLAEVQWFQNGDPIQQSEPVLTFSRITAKDSGNYSCSLRNFKTTIYFTYLFLIIVVSLFSLVFISAAVMLIRR
uniref:Sc:d156 n=1 Tax=Sinocyclocheilus grahami TaxID=75366 RepID=A0A672MD15_SINGR